MSKKKEETLKKVARKISENIQEGIGQTSLTGIDQAAQNSWELSGDPDCPTCGGVGYVRYDLPVGHPDFGKLQVCTCRQRQLDQAVYRKLFAHSQLDELSHLTFENFNPRGKDSYSVDMGNTVEVAYETAHQFSTNLRGWLVLQGGFGCGKTHLAAAVANFVVEMGVPTLFVTAPDLLDLLRFSFNDPETTFEQRFKDFRDVRLLVLDDFGTHNTTSWAQEKFFQILNHRYINKLPLVLTTNLVLDEIDARIRSRLQDDKFVTHVHIQAPDYRLSDNKTSNPGLSILSHLGDKHFGSFSLRREEIGKLVTSTATKTYRDARTGNIVKDTDTIKSRITAQEIETLGDAFEACLSFAEDPQGWLTLLGTSGCGKTHLAASIGNYLMKSGAPAILVEVPDLLDYMRATFQGNVVTYQQRMSELKSTPLLILDSLGKERPSEWGEEKLYQILSHRYTLELPTVIVSHLTLEQIGNDYESILTRILDTSLCSIKTIEIPRYENQSRRKKRRATKRS